MLRYLILVVICFFYASLSSHYSRAGGDVDQDISAAYALRNSVPIYGLEAKTLYEEDFGRKYSQTNYHPPFTSIIFLPFASYSAVSIFNAFNAISFIAVLCGIRIVFSITPHGKRKDLICMSLVLSYPVISSIANAQLSPILFFLIAASYWFIRSNRPIRSACMLGIAAAIKIYPLLYGVIYLIKKEYKALACFMLFFIIIQIFTFIIVGSGDYFYFFNHLDNGIGTYAHYVHNISLYSFFMLIQDYVNGDPIDLIILNHLVVLGMVIFLIRRLSKDSSYEFLYALFSVVVCLGTPIFWEHGLILCIFTLAFIINISRKDNAAILSFGIIFFYPNVLISQKLHHLYLQIPLPLVVCSKVITFCLLYLLYYLNTQAIQKLDMSYTKNIV